MWYVYALVSKKDKGLYIGISQNPKRRLKMHNAGMTRSTKSRRPFLLVFQESCGSRKAAREKEKFYKSGCGREQLKAFIKNKYSGVAQR